MTCLAPDHPVRRINGVIPVAPTGPGERAVQLPWSGRTPPPWRRWHDPRRSLAAVRSDPGLFFFTRHPARRSVRRRTEPASSAGDLRMLARCADLVAWVDWAAARAGTRSCGPPGGGPLRRTAWPATSQTRRRSIRPGLGRRAGSPSRAGWRSGPSIRRRSAAASERPRPRPKPPPTPRCGYWGMTRAEIALAAGDAWPLPALGPRPPRPPRRHPGEAQRFGGDRRPPGVVQVAVVLAEQAGTRLFLADEFDLAAALAELGSGRPTWTASGPVRGGGSLDGGSTASGGPATAPGARSKHGLPTC